MTDTPKTLEDMTESEQAEILLAWWHKRPLQFWASGPWADKESIDRPSERVAYRLKPEPRRGEGYVNIYSGIARICMHTHKSKADADEFASPGRIARVKVQWQEGQFDE